MHFSSIPLFLYRHRRIKSINLYLSSYSSSTPITIRWEEIRSHSRRELSLSRAECGGPRNSKIGFVDFFFLANFSCSVSSGSCRHSESNSEFTTHRGQIQIQSSDLSEVTSPSLPCLRPEMKRRPPTGSAHLRQLSELNEMLSGAGDQTKIIIITSTNGTVVNEVNFGVFNRLDDSTPKT